MKSPSKLLSEQRVAFFGTKRRKKRSPHADCQNRGTTEAFMNLSILAGPGLVLLRGVLQGLFAVPMNSGQRWKYENIWLVFALSGLVVFPWLLTATTVPHLGAVYRLTSTHSIIAITGFCLCWGAGATLTGLGLSMVGIGLSFAIILGPSASVGSLVPLLVLTLQKVGTSQGHLYFFGSAVMLIGIVAAARAGSLRDLSKKPVDSVCGVKIKGSFIARLVVAISAGLLSSALNFSYAFGTEPSRRHATCGPLLFGCQTLWQLRQQVAASLPIAFIACTSCTRTPRREISGSRTCGINWLYGSRGAGVWAARHLPFPEEFKLFPSTSAGPRRRQVELVVRYFLP